MTYSRGPENSIETACVVVVGFRFYDASWPSSMPAGLSFRASWPSSMPAGTDCSALVACYYPARVIEGSDR